MYEEYWGLKEKPFENTPDPHFLYQSPQHEEGLSRLLYVVQQRKGAGMLTGVFGCGKTLLSWALLNELDRDRYRLALITDPQVSPIELLRSIAHALGAGEIPLQKTDLLIIIKSILTNNMKDGKDSVVIIDEAHVIDDKDVFEQIRLLLNLQLQTRFLLTILLLGQPELRNKIDANKQLAQRIAMGYHLDPLSEEETSSYISHRLNIAKAQKPIFTDEAVKLIFQDSGGIPRRINQICDMGLFTGYAKKVEAVDEKIIQEAMDGLGMRARVIVNG